MNGQIDTPAGIFVGDTDMNKFEDHKRQPLTSALLSEVYEEFNGDGPHGRAVHAPNIHSVSLATRFHIYTYQMAKSIGELARETGLSARMIWEIIETYQPRRGFHA